MAFAGYPKDITRMSKEFILLFLNHTFFFIISSRNRSPVASKVYFNLLPDLVPTSGETAKLPKKSWKNGVRPKFSVHQCGQEIVA